MALFTVIPFDQSLLPDRLFWRHVVVQWRHVVVQRVWIGVTGPQLNVMKISKERSDIIYVTHQVGARFVLQTTAGSVYCIRTYLCARINGVGLPCPRRTHLRFAPNPIFPI